MKLLHKFIRFGFFCCMALSAGFGMTSCEDEPDKYEVADGVLSKRRLK